MGIWFLRLFVQSEHYLIVEDDITRILTHIGSPISSYIVKYAIFKVWATSKLRILIGKCQPLNQYAVYQCRWSQLMQGSMPSIRENPRGTCGCGCKNDWLRRTHTKILRRNSFEIRSFSTVKNSFDVLRSHTQFHPFPSKYPNGANFIYSTA